MVGLRGDILVYIVDFFKSLGDIISSIVDFIVDFFKNLIDFFASIPDYVSIVESFISLLPTEIKVFAVMVLASSLIFIVIGRRGV